MNGAHSMHQLSAAAGGANGTVSRNSHHHSNTLGHQKHSSQQQQQQQLYGQHAQPQQQQQQAHNSSSNNPRGYSSFTDSDHGDASSAVVSLNGTQIVMNNMARSRAPLPGFSSFV